MATKNDTSVSSSSSYESSSEEDEQISAPSGPSATTVTKATFGLKTNPLSQEEEDCDEHSSEEDEASSDSEQDVPTKEQTSSKAEMVAKEKKTCVSSEEEEESSEDDEASSEEEAPTKVQTPPYKAEMIAKEKEISVSSEEDEAPSEEEAPTKEQTPSRAEIAKEKQICVSLSEEKEEDSSGEESSEEDDASFSEEEVPTRKEILTKAEMIAKEKDICVSSKAQKRVSEGISSEDMNNAAKKVKRSGKKLVPPRFWTAEDEVRLLEGIIEFQSATGKTFLQEKNGFYDFIKDSFTVKVTLSQCISKISSLQKKYRNKATKGKKPSALKPLDLKVFELSGRIWEYPVSGTNDRIQKLEGDTDVMNHGQGGDWFSNSVLVRLVANLGMDEDSVKMDWGRVSEDKKREMMDRWRVLKAKDDETLLQKSAFVDDIVSLIYR